MIATPHGDHRDRRALVARALLAALVSMTVLVIPGAASGRPAKGVELSPTQTMVVENYPAFVASSPAPGTVGAANHSPEECRTAQHCDTINVRVTLPRDYEYHWGLKLTVTWTASTRAHDIDIFFYDEFEGFIRSSATQAKPEVISVNDRDNALVAGLYYLVVVNYVGPPNDPYQLTAEFIQQDQVQEPGRPENPFRVIERGGGGGSQPPSSFGGSIPAGPTAGGLQGVGGAPTFEPLRVAPPSGTGEATGRRVPLAARDGATGPGLELDGKRMLTGLGLLALLGGLAYALFFAPARRPGPASPSPA